MDGIEVRPLAFAMLRAPQDHVALVRRDEDELLLPIQAAKGRVALPPGDPRLDRHADAAVAAEVEDHGGVAPEAIPPVEEDDVHAADVRETIGARLVIRR